MSSGAIATDASANGAAQSPPPQSNGNTAMTYASVISLHQLNIAVIAVLVLLVLLVLVLSIAKARSTWLHRRAVLRQQAESAQNLRPVGHRGLLVDDRPGNGIPEELIKLLGQVVAFEAAKVGGECESERECIVCLGEYNEGDMVRVLDACHHMFHQVRRVSARVALDRRLIPPPPSSPPFPPFPSPSFLLVPPLLPLPLCPVPAMLPLA
ncbi:unnamed protein product [Closterium sp. NIES-64]|nr:unnamed protein product [Closterium sp. NIES-64]